MTRRATEARKRLSGQHRRARVLLAGVAGLAVVAVLTILAVIQLSSSNGAAPSIARLNTKDQHSLIIAPGNLDVLVFGHHDGILRSSDGGMTWAELPGLRDDAMNLSVGRQNPNVLYLAGHNVFLKSEDQGETWHRVSNNLPGLDLHWFAMDPDDSAKLYANAVGFGLFRSSDGGASWTRWDIDIPGGAPATALAVLGGEPVNVLAGTQDGLVLFTSDGAHWDQVARLDAMVTAFALNPDAVTIYGGTTKGLYRSQDKGLSWKRLPINTTVVALAAGGANPERVVAVNDRGEVFRSDDGGTTW